METDLVFSADCRGKTITLSGMLKTFLLTSYLELSGVGEPRNEDKLLTALVNGTKASL